ncbi:hypothetical protein QFZ67_004619 [Streptomyces sp. V1I1]|nr:hypothetical protein [Streptomyces sp. V1I1]
MSWWLRVRAAPAIFGSLLLVGCVAVVIPSSSVPLPSIAGALGTGLPLRYLAPILPTLIVLYGQSRADHAAEKVAVRSVPVMDAIFVVTVAVVALVSAPIVPDGIAVGRNVVGYLGLGLTIRWLTNYRVAAAVSTFVPFFIASLGMQGHRPVWWAWALHEGGDLFSAGCALGLFCMGTALLFRAPLLRSSEQNEESS